MKSLLRWLLTPFFNLMLHLHQPGDDWEEVKVRVPPWRFGRGSRRRFSWYFEGESTVSVSSLEDVVEWLAGCEYTSDTDLFRELDYWQHPLTFEQLRKGDCEDFALWAWRRLNELGIPAQLFVGRRVSNGTQSVHGHAWVVLDGPDGPTVLEGSSRDADHALRPLNEVSENYRPHFSVDATYRSTSYTGWLTTAKEDRARRKKFGRADIVGE